MKLKLTDSPGIAGGFYWIHQKKLQTLDNKGLQRCSLASMRGFEPPTPRLGEAPIRHQEMLCSAKKSRNFKAFSLFHIS